MRQLLLLLFILVCSGCNAADINYSLDGTASTSYTIGTATSAVANMHDNSESTSFDSEFQYGSVPPLPYLAIIQYTAEIDFGVVADTITSVELVHMESNRGTLGNQQIDVQLYYGGAWHTVMNGTYSTSKITESQSGTWNNVTKVRLNVHIDSSLSISPSNIYQYIYELRAIGPAPTGNYIISFI